MKKSFLFLLVAAVAIISAQAQTKADLSETALENLDKANMLTNSGENEAAMEILNKLDKENPNNYYVLWEMAYTYWFSGEYKKSFGTMQTDGKPSSRLLSCLSTRGQLPARDGKGGRSHQGL